MCGCVKVSTVKKAARAACSKGLPGLVALLFTALVLAAGGCMPADRQDKAEPAPYYQELPPLEAKPLVVLAANPVTIESVSIELAGENWNEVIYISGLADSRVEAIINDTLSETYERLKNPEPPPYRGIYRVIPAGATPVSQSLYAYVTFNYQNILSVYISSDRVYELSPQDNANPGADSAGYYPETFYTGQVECLNFNLESGRQILLPELYADPSSAMMHLNDAMAKVLNQNNAGDDQGYATYYYDTPLLTGPFKGLPDSQKYNLTNGGINIIIDHLNPEFDLYFYPAHVYLPFYHFDKHLAIEERFAADRSALYLESDYLELEFALGGEADPDQMVRFEEATESGMVQGYLSYSYPVSLPGPIELRVAELLEELDQTFADLENYQPGAAETDLYFDASLTVNRTGPFYALRLNIFSYASDSAGYSSRLECYNREGYLLRLEDCFTPAFNYREKLYTLYLEHSTQFGLATLDRETFFENLSFTLGITDLELSVGMGAESYNYYFPYRDLGFENLVIFE